MTATVIEAVATGATAFSSSRAISISTTPQPGDVVIAVASKTTTTSCSGLGATWTKVYEVGQLTVFIGTGATSAGSVTVSGSTNYRALQVFLVRGLNTATLDATVTSSGATITAGPGNLVLATILTLSTGTLAPGLSPGSGWSAGYQSNLFSADRHWGQYRAPSTSETHSTTPTGVSIQQIAVFRFGDEVPDVPADPTALTATAASPYAIDLDWTDNATTETGYTVQRCTGGACTDYATIATLPAGTESYADTGLTPETTYRYRVRADATPTPSGWAGPAAATTGAVPPDPGGSIDPGIPDDRPNTGPFSPEVAEVITGGVVEITGRIRFPGTGAAPVELAILDGRLSWSERRSPRFTASLDCAIPDPDIIALIDPRALVRVDVKIGYRLPDGSLDEQVVATPHLRDRRIIRPAEVLRLELAGDEALVIDAAAVIGDVDSGVWDRPKTDVPRSVAQLVTGLLSTGPAAYPPIVYQVDKVGTGEDVPWPPNDYWDGLEDLLEQIGAELAVDDGRTFVIRRRPTTVEATSAFMLRTGVGGVVLESDSAASRADWANQVVLTHRWTDAAGDTHTVQGVATVTGGPFTPALAGLRTYTERRSTPITEGGATKAAQTLLRRMLSRSRSYVMTAPSAYWLRPGHTVTVDLDAADSTRHLVAEVDHTLADGRMRVTTRLPDTASTIGE